MRKLSIFIALLSCVYFPVTAQSVSKEKIEIMLLGTAHFGQKNFYSQELSMDLFSADRQKEIDAVNRQLSAYHPDLILIEREPGEQHTVDSLYQLYLSGNLDFANIEYGRAEEFQFGYRLGKQLKLPRLIGVDFYNGLSTRILSNGEHIEDFNRELTKFGTIGRSVDQQLKDRKMSLVRYLLKLNDPQIYNLTYHTLFVQPAYVTNGSFTKTDRSVDTARIDKQYIGAEYITLFYNRELKIFSNILRAQQAGQSKRILVIIGQRHAAVLSKLFAEEPAFKVVPLSKYLN